MIGNHIKTALKSMRRSPFQMMAAVLVLSITFWVATVFSVLLYSSDQLLRYFTTRPQIIAFLKSDTLVEDMENLQSRLSGDDRVKQVSYVSREEALEIYMDLSADNPLIAELVDPSTLPASLEFTMMDLEFADELIGELKEEGIVDSVGFTASLGKEEDLGRVVERLRNIAKYIRVGGLVAAGVLGTTSFLVLTIVIGMRITTRRAEIETLKLIGATSGFVAMPVIFESLFYAFFGVLLGWMVGLIMILYTTPTILSYFGDIAVLPRDTGNFFGLLLLILLVELVVGKVIALLGGLLALARARRKG